MTEEMRFAGVKCAWEDHGVVLHGDEAVAIYLAMKAAEPLPQGDERLNDLLHILAICEVGEANAVERIYRFAAQRHAAITVIGSQSIEGERG